jgi:NhaB family Na+:H+ antiporter
MLRQKSADGVYHEVASNPDSYNHNHHNDDHLIELHREGVDQFRTFLHSLMINGAVGTTLDSVTT